MPIIQGAHETDSTNLFKRLLHIPSQPILRARFLFQYAPTIGEREGTPSYVEKCAKESVIPSSRIVFNCTQSDQGAQDRERFEIKEVEDIQITPLEWKLDRARIGGRIERIILHGYSETHAQKMADYITEGEMLFRADYALTQMGLDLSHDATNRQVKDCLRFFCDRSSLKSALLYSVGHKMTPEETDAFTDWLRSCGPKVNVNPQFFDDLPKF